MVPMEEMEAMQKVLPLHQLLLVLLVHKVKLELKEQTEQTVRLVLQVQLVHPEVVLLAHQVRKVHPVQMEVMEATVHRVERDSLELVERPEQLGLPKLLLLTFRLGRYKRRQNMVLQHRRFRSPESWKVIPNFNSAVGDNE
jgi:hypothetical protein